ncbi:unnamed protein product [Symbiodinium natans]|uniref:NADP-dependent oxidoreductase domain-containing protein n=1 Tax=Symbiodinium natans TaxID=878477 RepID=A0A812I7K8_9DINO|nr:unnamed protein product [Symbiodinium natans]
MPAPSGASRHAAAAFFCKQRLQGRRVALWLLLSLILYKVSSRWCCCYVHTQRYQAAQGAVPSIPGRREAVVAGALLPLPVKAEVSSNTAVGGDRVVLKGGLPFPKASFGLQVYSDETAERLTQMAIDVGYRNFFASVLAGNQKGFARGVKKSGIPREELFICGSVVSQLAQDFEDAYLATKKGCAQNLEAFAEGGITELDMIMLDYPAKDCETIRGQWKAFEEMLAAGQTKSLAVSNFSPEQLDCIFADSDATPPVLNQLPYSLKSYDDKAVRENGKRGILVQAWGPLGSGSLGISASKLAEDIGQKYGKTAAQVALRWIVQTGATFTTQSKNKDHLKEDLQIFDFALTDEEVLQLSDLSTSLAGRVSALADVVVPVGGAVGGALLISAVLDSMDSTKPQNEAADVKKATSTEPGRERTKKVKEDEDDDDDDGAL